MIRSLTVLLCLALASLAFAQVPSGQSPQEKRPKSPFRIDETLGRILGTRAQRPGDEQEFRKLSGRPALPTMTLRGLIRKEKADDWVALVSIEGVGVYTVREEDRLAFTIHGAGVSAARVENSTPSDPAPGDPAERRTPDAKREGSKGPSPLFESLPVVLKVLHVGRDGVVVEIGTLGEVLIIR